MNKICVFCGKEFTTKSSRKKYCDGPHYMNCPICGKEYIVTDINKLKEDPVTCSQECRAELRKKTSLKRYGITSPGNYKEAREKAKATMKKNHGVEYAMQSKEVMKKSKETMIEKYGVDNIQKRTESSNKRIASKRNNWINKVHKLLPLKLAEKPEMPSFRIDEESMQVYILSEEASTSFLKEYGHNLIHKFSKIHVSVGLVNDNILYQVLRFEKIPEGQCGGIRLADFGTRAGYVNPKGYSKLLEFVLETKVIDSFIADIPRNVATDLVLESLNLKKIYEGEYTVAWILSDTELKPLKQWDNIEDMMSQYDYVTTDYIDRYEFNEDAINNKTDINAELLMLSRQ